MPTSTTNLNLDVWIQVATHGLPRSKQARLRGEIEDHYAMLVSKFIADGKSQSQATALALVQLGVPNEIGKQYRDIHFSKSRYTQGMWAIPLWTLMLLVDSIIKQQIIFIEWPQSLLWNIFISLASGILAVTIFQALLTLCHERYDVQVLEQERKVFIAAVGVSVSTSALYWVMHLFPSHSLLTIEQAVTIFESPLWRIVFPILPIPSWMAAAVAGVMLFRLTVHTWRTLHSGLGLSSQTGIFFIGLASIVLLGHTVIAMGKPPVIHYSHVMRYYLQFATPIVIGLVMPMFVMLFTLFRNISLPSRSLTIIVASEQGAYDD